MPALAANTPNTIRDCPYSPPISYQHFSRLTITMPLTHQTTSDLPAKQAKLQPASGPNALT